MSTTILSADSVVSARARLRLAAATSFALLLCACGGGNAPPNANAPVPKPAASAPAPAVPAAAPAPSSTVAAAEQAAQAAQARMETMSVQQLLAEARTAFGQQRLLAPKGNNAFEYYEKALQKDPKNQVAQDALREAFPVGANMVEQTIGQNNYDEAQREIDLLAKADPSNYTLTILRSKLEAAKRQQQRADALKAKQAADLAAKQAEIAKAAAAAAAKAAAPPPAPAPAPVVQQPVVEQPKPVPVQAAPEPPPPKPAGETRGAEPISQAAPNYPLEAARNQTSGYAVVEFTVNADGSVSGARVTDSQPPRVFNSAAIQAVSRSRYRPALKDGQPVSSSLQRRVDFKFGG
ncbi:MAG: energy transducer TonB [Rhodanobacteraceae bacterium]